MQKSAFFTAAGVAVALMVGSEASAQQPDTARTVPPAPAMPTPAAQPATSPTVIETLREAGNFTVLLDLIESAGLDSTLMGDGPFTLFAPTDEAFAQIPEVVRTALVSDSAQLRQLLLNHVVEGKLSAADVQAVDSASTLAGGTVAVTSAEGEVRIDNAVVTTPDLVAENGVVHAVSAVLLPSTDATAAPAPTTIPPVTPAPQPVPPTVPPTTVPPVR